MDKELNDMITKLARIRLKTLIATTHEDIISLKVFNNVNTIGLFIKALRLTIEELENLHPYTNKVINDWVKEK